MISGAYSYHTFFLSGKPMTDENADTTKKEARAK